MDKKRLPIHSPRLGQQLPCFHYLCYCTPGFEFRVLALNTRWFVQWVKNGNIAYMFLGFGLWNLGFRCRVLGLGTWHSALGDLCTGSQVSGFGTRHSVSCAMREKWICCIHIIRFQASGFGLRTSGFGPWTSELRPQHSALGDLCTGCRVLGFGTRHSVICAMREIWICCIHIFGFQASGFGLRTLGFGPRHSALGTWWFVYRVSSFGFWYSTLGDLCNEGNMDMLYTYFRVSGFGFWASDIGLRASALGIGWCMLHTGFQVLGFGTRHLVICAMSENMDMLYTCFRVLGFGLWGSALSTRYLVICVLGLEFRVLALDTWWFVQWMKNGHFAYMFLGSGLRILGLRLRVYQHSALSDLINGLSSFRLWVFRCSCVWCKEIEISHIFTSFQFPVSSFGCLGVRNGCCTMGFGFWASGTR